MLPAVSNSIGNVSFTTDQLLAHAVRRCGKMSGALPAEIGEALPRIAFAWLSNLANRGVQLWTVTQTTLGLIPNQIVYPLPVGTVEVQRLLYRTLDLTPSDPTAAISEHGYGTGGLAFNGTPFTTTAWVMTQPNGYLGYDFAPGNPDGTPGLGIMPTTVSWMTSDTEYLALSVDYADTLGSWTTWVLLDGDPVPGNTNNLIQSNPQQWVCRDIPQTPVPHRYWRVALHTPATTTYQTVNMLQVQFGTNPNEVQMARFNRDQYQQQNNKRSQSGTGVLNYWYDKQNQNPNIVVWPVPATAFDQISVWRYRHIMDPGPLTGALEMPQRWWLASIDGIAEEIFKELPDMDLKRYPLVKQWAADSLAQAEAGETDGAPLLVMPTIGGYTR